jgi:hypothetical protein
MQEQYKLMPDWAKKQLWATDTKIRSMDNKNPMSESERKLAKKWMAELPSNEAKYAQFLAEATLKPEAKAKIKIPLASLKRLGLRGKK